MHPTCISGADDGVPLHAVTLVLATHELYPGKVGVCGELAESNELITTTRFSVNFHIPTTLNMASQAVQRVSLRWLPDPAFEDTDTVALNVGGYFVDLRVVKDTQTVQWSRAGERITLRTNPRKCSIHIRGHQRRFAHCIFFPHTATFRWTHIIDSLDLSVPDEAHFEKLPNGDDLEIGTTPAPHLDNKPTDYEEVWRDITAKRTIHELSWILQSVDGLTFLGKVGSIYLAIRKSSDGSFAAIRQDLKCTNDEYSWNTTFESGDLSALPLAYDAISAVEGVGNVPDGTEVMVGQARYVVRAISTQ